MAVRRTRTNKFRGQLFDLHQHLQWLWKASRTPQAKWYLEYLKRRKVERQITREAARFMIHMDESLPMRGLIIASRRLWAPHILVDPTELAKQDKPILPPGAIPTITAQVSKALEDLVAGAMDISPAELIDTLAGAAETATSAALGGLGLPSEIVWEDAAASWKQLFPELAKQVESMLADAAAEHAVNVADLLVEATDPRRPMTIAQATKGVRSRLKDITKWKALQIARTETARSYGITAQTVMERNGIKARRVLTAAKSPVAAISPVCSFCQDAASMGWTDVTRDFGGHGMHPPFHPNCRCDIGADTRGWLPPMELFPPQE